MRKLSEPKSGILTLKYLPDSTEVIENPPRFSWMPCNRENGPYTLEISTDKEFKDCVLRYDNIPQNYFAPDKALAVGEYFWRFTLAGGEYDFSSVREFEIVEGIPETPFAGKETRFDDMNMAHPRLWLTADTLVKFRKELAKDPSYCKFDTFLEKTAKRYIDKEFVAEPLPYPNGKREILHWRKSYSDCQEAFNHIRFVSIAGVVCENEDWIKQAIAATLAAARWDKDGTTSRHYNDECGFRMAGMLAWGYDWLYNYMTKEEKEEVESVLIYRASDVQHHAFVSSKIHYSLYDSHAVRSIPSVMVPCAIALFGEHDKATDWLNQTIDYMNVLYSPWGGKDGGWSEGCMYWTTGMAFMLEGANLMKNATGFDIFKRPFFKETANFPIYCNAHDTYRASFGDQSSLGNKAILKTGFNARDLAGATGNGVAQWYFQQIAKRESYDDPSFFNVGWWDFYFNETFYLSNYGNIEAVAPKAGRNCKWFKDVGWVALHANMHDEKNHIGLLTKSSPYGSVSHSHGDQNAITLTAFGDTLLAETGYYIGFNASMHKDWRKQSRAHNLITINGQNQYAKFDKTIQLAAVGAIESVTETENYVHVVENATAGYLPNVPTLKSYKREIYFIDNEYFVIMDNVELTEPGYVGFHLHSMFEPEIDGELATFKGPNAKLDAEIVFTSAGIKNIYKTDDFEGVNEKEYADLGKQWHYNMETRMATNHVIVTCLTPSKVEEYKEIGTIKDDQGHDVFLYFTNDGKTFPLVIDGDKRY